VLGEAQPGAVPQQPVEHVRRSDAVAAMTLVWKGPNWSETWV
jgi:hypothetical protein